MEQKKSDQIIVYSTVWCPDCKRAKKFFGEQRVPYVNIDIEQDAEAMAFVEKVNDGKRIIPTIVFPDGSTKQFCKPCARSRMSSLPAARQRLPEMSPVIKSNAASFWKRCRR